MRTYYFDHCASTSPYPQVIRTVTELMTVHYANPSALHQAGTDAMKLVDRARSAVALACGSEPSEVIFTSGGTESNNLAIKGVIGWRGTSRSRGHLITSSIEHSSVYDCAKQLEEQGVRVTYLPVDATGRVSAADVEEAIEEDTLLVSIMHVNNETGALQPIKEIGRRLAGYPQIRFHVDGAQAVGKLPIPWREAAIDLYSASAHKFGGPRGVGFLLVRNGLRLEPLLAGGGQEQGARSGTHNVPGIVGMAQAIRLAVEEMPDRQKRFTALRRQLINRVKLIPQLVLNMPEDESITSLQVINLSYPGMRPEVFVHMLEQRGVLVSTQSACSSKSLKPSRVLRAMGLDDFRASGSLRISLGDEHTEEDIDALADRLADVVTQLKPLERK